MVLRRRSKLLHQGQVNLALVAVALAARPLHSRAKPTHIQVLQVSLVQLHLRTRTRRSRQTSSTRKPTSSASEISSPISSRISFLRTSSARVTTGTPSSTLVYRED